jgi:valine--pyruvate aminotransferase
VELRLSEFGRRLTAPTGINELMEDLGQAFANAGPDTVMMGGGNPAHIPAVEAVWRRRLEELLAEPGVLSMMLGDYDGPQGKVRFLDTFAAYLRRTRGFRVGPENIAITAGSQTGCFLLFNMLAGEAGPSGRRRLLLPLVPEYIGYADQVLCDGAFVACEPTIETRGRHRFKYHVDFDALRVGDDIAAIVLSRPTNPSSNVVGDAELRRLAALARERDALLVIDNAYGLPFPGIIFGDAEPPAWDEHCVFTFSLSKLGLPSTRTGIVVAAPEVIRRLSAMNAVVGLANGSIGQVMTEPLFASGAIDRIAAEHIRPYYLQRAQETLAVLDEVMGDDVDWAVHEPEGAFFLWLWFRDLPIDDRELYRRLKARGVIAVPGSYFFYGLERDWAHRRQCLRLSYGQPRERVRRGLEILADVVRQARKG